MWIKGKPWYSQGAGGTRASFEARAFSGGPVEVERKGRVQRETNTVRC